jgi:hypothetical protein
MAEDKKITDLTALLPSEVAVEDVLVIVDVDINPFLSETKKITVSDLLISKLPGDFSSLRINTGQIITEFSIDTTLGGDSDNAVPTEKAVKGYVDAAISSLEPDQIWADDSYVKVVDDGTTAGLIEIVADGTQVAYFDSLASTQRIGKQSNAGRLEISDTSSKLFGSNDKDALVKIMKYFNNIIFCSADSSESGQNINKQKNIFAKILFQHYFCFKICIFFINKI